MIQIKTIPKSLDSNANLSKADINLLSNEGNFKYDTNSGDKMKYW